MNGQDTTDSYMEHVIKELLLEVLDELKEDQQVFSKEEAAHFLRVNVGTLERMAFRKNELAYSKPGKNAVFLRSDLLEFLKRRRIPSVFDEGV